MKGRFLLLWLAALLTLAGCAPATSIPPTPTLTPTPEPTATPTASPTITPTPGMEEGSFILPLPSGKNFGGHVRGHGDTVVMLANMGTGDETQWSRLVNKLDLERYTVITFFWIDAYSERAEAAAILEYVRAAGMKKLICIGASMGVIACGSLSDEPETIGLVLIAGPYSGSLAEADYPKLFLAGERDYYANDAEMLYEAAPEPKELILYPEAAHGTTMFGTSSGDEFLNDLLTFIDEAAALAE